MQLLQTKPHPLVMQLLQTNPFQICARRKVIYPAGITTTAPESCPQSYLHLCILILAFQIVKIGPYVCFRFSAFPYGPSSKSHNPLVLCRKISFGFKQLYIHIHVKIISSIQFAYVFIEGKGVGSMLMTISGRKIQPSNNYIDTLKLLVNNGTNLAKESHKLK